MKANFQGIPGHQHLSPLTRESKGIKVLATNVTASEMRRSLAKLLHALEGDTVVDFKIEVRIR